MRNMEWQLGILGTIRMKVCSLPVQEFQKLLFFHNNVRHHFSLFVTTKKKVKSPVTDPERLQEVKVPRFRDNGTGWW